MVAGPSAAAARASSAIAPVRARSTSASTSAWSRASSALTLFAFSSENWGRPEEEVGALMKLFLRALDREVDELHRRGVRMRFIGERERFAAAIRERMASAEDRPRANTAPAPDHRRQLRRSLGHRPGRARAGARTSPPAGCAPKTSTKPLFAPAPVAGRPAAAGPVHPHRRRHCASATSCSGSWPTPNCGSPRLLWPDLDAATLQPRPGRLRQPRAPLRPDRRAGAPRTADPTNGTAE